MKLKFLAVLLLTLGACAHGRYTMPVSPFEAQTIYPSVVSVAQQQGHQAWLNGNQLTVQMQDGTRYIWYPQNNGTVGLAVQLEGEVKPEEEGARLATAKQRADQLWQDGLAARQQYGGGNVILFTQARNGPGSDCRTGSDGYQVCGYDCRIGSNGRANCASTPDGRCMLNSDGSISCGVNCQLLSNGRHLCD